MSNYIPSNDQGGSSKYKITDQRHMPLFLINGQLPPNNVKYGYTESTEQLVKSQRNSKGEIVSEKVGRRLLKFDNLEWPILANSSYRWLQSQVEKFYCYVTYYDARYGGDDFRSAGGFVTKKFYWGDFSGEPFEFERDTSNGLLLPKYYINVKVNLIDCGEDYLKPNDPHWCSPTKYPPPYRGSSGWPVE